MKKLTFVFAVVCGLLYSSSAYPQLPNMILLEEATNASCGPCASQNPYLEQFLQDNSGAVIGVSYHAWWPGSTDPMYTGDASMNTNRITYYGFDQIGVPTCVVNGSYATPSSGWYQGAPGDIDALTNAVSDAQGIDNPYTMMINRYVNTKGDSEQVRITVSSTQSVTNAYLRVIVVEGEHQYTNAGNNGEKIFRNIARKMLPTYKGTKFSLAANGSSTFLFKYKYDSKWTTDQLSIIAFVQDDGDKSVGTAVQSVDPPSSGFVLSVPVSQGSKEFNMNVSSTINPNAVTYTHEGDQSLKVTFSVIDLLGRLIQPEQTEIVSNGTNGFGLHTAGLAAGTYRVLARTPTSIIEVPFVIVH
ncbi:MAG: Omp28-related outer membrane protein [Bacteroidota bacterium]|nr:Omp28-related outer membrane protein [Bacteroidota bacterium]MDP4235731.1 Omp28-related outer membrane protein [Bacteroidota bacterium]